MRDLLPILALVSLLVPGFAAADEPALLVACAPGYPGSTEQARPTMDGFAAAVALRAGWEAGALAAVYHEQEDAGLAALAEPRAALALVPLPFFLKHRKTLDLDPLLEVIPVSGENEVWSLVARKGAVRGPEDLAGWELTGIPGYAPGFVRRVALDSWTGLPEDVRIRSSSRVLSDLRRAVQGEPVAVLLDGAQAAALGALPFASDLEVVARSAGLPGSLLCNVGQRFSAGRAEPLKRVLLDLDQDEPGREVLASLRIARFQGIDGPTLQRIESAFESGGGGK